MRERLGMRGPDFFIVGAAKAGTTALRTYLRRHPEIFMPAGSLNWFGSDLAWGPMQRNLTWDEYLAAFSGGEDARRLGEGSGAYLCSRRAAEEIKSYRPHAQIIVMLRNPVEALHALHAHLVYLGGEDISDLEQALAAEPDRRAGRRIPRSNRAAWALDYRNAVRYRAQLERYLNAFGRDRVHVIVYDDFKRDPAAAYRATLEFLGVDPDFTPEFDVVNRNRRARIRRLSRALPPGPRAASSGPWVLMRRLARVVIPSRPARRRLYSWITRANTVHAPRPALPPELRRRLEEELANEVDELGELLDRDLSHWVGGRARAGTPWPESSSGRSLEQDLVVLEQARGPCDRVER